jgi:RNA polymerase sigma factor (sigma-70 family)
MAKRSSPILHLIRRLVADPGIRCCPDKELLERFLDQQDEAAFETLVRRHGPLVLDVCRGVLFNETDVEDVFQAAFLILARKAGSIRKTESLASWLHGVAYHMACKARTEFARRRKHEARAPTERVGQPENLAWNEVRHILHEELNAISERHRAPLVLCYLEGKTQDEAAVALGLSKGTLKRRLKRGRALLRARLVRRGFGAMALLLVSARPTVTHASLATSLVLSTVKAATTVAAGGAMASAVSAKVAAVVKGGLNGVTFAKLTVMILVLVGIGALGSGARLLHQTRAADSPQARRADSRSRARTSDEKRDAKPSAAPARDQGQPGPKESVAEATRESRRDRYQELVKEFENAEERSYKAFDEAIAKAKTEEEKKRAYQLAQDLYPDRLQCAHQLLKLAQVDPTDPLIVDVVFWICTHRLGSPAYHAIEGESLQLLAQHHLEGAKALERLPWLCEACADGMTSEREAFLCSVLEKSRRHEIRAAAAYSLGLYRKAEAEWVVRIRTLPGQVAFMVHVQGKERTKELRTKDSQELRQEAEKYLRLVQAEYGDVVYWSRSVEERLGSVIDGLLGKSSHPTTYGKMAAVQLGALQNLTIGRHAPEIEGRDLEGKKFKLSDYRGKVVVVSFWATWCPPCMRLVEKERLLVDRYKDKPFVLLGVNGDASNQAVLDAVAKHRINWRSWVDGKGGPIAKQWNVSGWPTVVAIDRNGVIRLRDAEPQFIEEAVETLLSEGQSKRPPGREVGLPQSACPTQDPAWN